jgi:hypothetical protein
MNAATQRPTRTRRIDQSLSWFVLMKTSTYRTQPTAMAALPAHPVIQYDQALTNPCRLPKARRAYAYGPPSAGMRRDSAAKSIPSARAPTVVRAIETREIGP